MTVIRKPSFSLNKFGLLCFFLVFSSLHLPEQAFAEKGYQNWLFFSPSTRYAPTLYATEEQACEQGFEEQKPTLGNPTYWYQQCAILVSPGTCLFGNKTGTNPCQGQGSNLGGELKECPTGKLKYLGASIGFKCDANALDPSKAPGANRTCVGNPCDPATGNKYQKEVDYRGAGPLPLVFERHYSSLQPRLANIGRQWRHTFDRQIIPLLFTGANSARAIRPDGKEFLFSESGSVWLAEADVPQKLERLPDNTWRLTNESDEIESYNANGRLLSIANRAGLTQTLSYDSASRLATVTDSFGSTLTFFYADATSPTIIKFTDPAGKEYLFGYDSLYGNLISVTYPDDDGNPANNPVRTYHYNEAAFMSGGSYPHALTGITDENTNRFATYQYHANGRAKSTEHAGGAERVTLSYPTGTTASVTFDIDVGLSATRDYAFQTSIGVQRNTSISGPACPQCGPAFTTYDANGYIASRTDWNGNKTCHTHDARGLETVRVEGLPSSAACPYTGALTGVQRKITTVWHATYRLPTQIAEPLRITTNVYGDPADPNPGNRGSLLSRTVQATTDVNGSAGLGATVTGSPRVWAYTYNANGQVLTEDGPRTDVADVTTYTYYANNATCPGASATGCRGQVQSITNAAGHLTTVTDYNAHGQPLVITDPNGLVTTLAYDARMRLTSRNVGGETTGYTYDNVGQLTRVTLPDASYLEYVYDAAHRLTEIRDNLGNKIIYTLDAMGNRKQEQVFDPTNQLKQTRSREYNNLNRLVKDIGGTNPTTQITQYGYDNQGNLTSVDGPLNNTTANDVRTYTYDALNRLATQVDPSGAVGGTTVYGYSGLDQLASVTDPRNLVTSYSYDGLNNLNQQLSPDTGATVNTFDAAGNILTSTDAKGQVTSYTYDALNRVASITYQGGVVHTYQYDQGTNGKGRLTQITEPNSVTQYGYDQKGRLTAETRTINAVAYTTGYGYDGFGRLASITYPSGRTVTYTLDSLGRIQSIATTKDSTTQTVVSGIAYRPFGPFQAFDFGNGQTHSRGFDQDGRIASYSLLNQSVPVQSLALGYDEASRIVQLSDTVTPANTNLYGYDSLDRLLNMTAPSSNQGYTYDAVGNRLTKTVGANSSTYAYAPTSNRLSTITGANPRSYAYDNNGSITGDSVNTFGYDTRGRLMQAITAGGTTSYQVNSLGQRIRKTNTQGDTVFHYDAQGRLIAESGTGGAIQKEYIYLGDTPVAVIQ